MAHCRQTSVCDKSQNAAADPTLRLVLMLIWQTLQLKLGSIRRVGWKYGKVSANWPSTWLTWDCSRKLPRTTVKLLQCSQSSNRNLDWPKKHISDWIWHLSRNLVAYSIVHEQGKESKQPFPRSARLTAEPIVGLAPTLVMTASLIYARTIPKNWLKLWLRFCKLTKYITELD